MCFFIFHLSTRIEVDVSDLYFHAYRRGPYTFLWFPNGSLWRQF